MNMSARDYVIALKESGLTQTKISEGSGLSQSAISKIESGHVKDVMSRSFSALQSLHKSNCKQPRKQRQTQEATNV